MSKHGWTYKKLGDVAEIVGGSTPKTSNPDFWGGEHYWVTPAELGDFVYINKTERTITDEALAKTNLTLLPVGTVLLSSRAPIGKTAITTVPMYCNQGFKNIICSKVLNNKFVYYYINRIVPKLQSLGRGVTFKEISKSIVESTTIPVPGMAEQEAIVAELDEINEAIAALQQQVADLDTLAQSTFYDMFGDPVTNPKAWPIKKLGEVATSKIGLTYKPTDVNEDGIVVLRSGNIQNSIIDLNDLVRVQTKVPEDKIVRKNDILMCTRNGSFRLVGKVALIGDLEEKMTYGAFMTVIRSEYYNYLFNFFKSPAYRVQLGSAGTSTINQITVKMLNDLMLPIPPLALQQEFAARVEAIESAKAELNAQIAEMQTLLASRMDFYFA